MTSSTIILVGGPMTLSDGSTLDSRQPLHEDPYSLTSLRGLVWSLPWWLAVSSVVEPILRERDQEAFALVIGNRSIKEMRWEGSTKRTALRRLLKGGVGELVIRWRRERDDVPEDLDEVIPWQTRLGWEGFLGLRRPPELARWVFLDAQDVVLEDARTLIAPTVLVDATASYGLGPKNVENVRDWPSAVFEDFEACRLFAPFCVLPHTHRVRKFLDAYVAWVARDRHHQALKHAEVEASDSPYLPRPIDYVQPFAVEADFRVTGLIQNGEWGDHLDLDAARSLLAARYDLNVGLFDLAGNAHLRETLLRHEDVPVEPTDGADMPEIVRARATKEADAAQSRRLAQESAVSSVAGSIELHMTRAAWTRPKSRGPGALWRPLTMDFVRSPGDDPFPLLWLGLDIRKHRVTVSVSTSQYNRVDLGQFVAEHREEFEHVSGPLPDPNDPAYVELWCGQFGWADDADWAAVGGDLERMTFGWITILEEFASTCISAWKSVFEPTD